MEERGVPMNMQKSVKNILKKLSKIKEVDAIAFYGSIGLGFNDKFSDVDIVVYVNRIPSEKNVKNILGYKKLEKVLDNIYFLRHHKKDFGIVFLQREYLDQIVKDLNKGNYLSSDIAIYIQNVKPVFGKKIIKNYKNKIKKYPKEIFKKEILHLRGITTFFEDLEKTIKRKNLIWLKFQLFQCIERLIRSLYALNRVYYPNNVKWAFIEMKRFKKLPKNFLRDVDHFLLSNSLKDRLYLIEKMLFDISKFLTKDEKRLIKIKSKKWYESKIKEIEIPIALNRS